MQLNNGCSSRSQISGNGGIGGKRSIVKSGDLGYDIDCVSVIVVITSYIESSHRGSNGLIHDRGGVGFSSSEHGIQGHRGKHRVVKSKKVHFTPIRLSNGFG